MFEDIRKIIDSYTLNALQVAYISIISSILTFILTNLVKNYFENRLLKRNLETEHKFEQQKQIKEAISKYKVHLLTSCEDVNHRLWNLLANHKRGWLNVNGDYLSENYYFHSTVYKILCLYFWIGRAKKEMIFLDTTVASKGDLEFIKFLKFFPNVLCDLTFIAGKDADGSSANAIDHFFRTEFEEFPDLISEKEEPVTYSVYKSKIPTLQQNLLNFYKYIDGITPSENRMRWDRLHLLHLTTIIFLNNYGYDFQQTSDTKIEEVLTKSKVSKYLKNYHDFLKEYKLGENKEVKRIKDISQKYYSPSVKQE